MVRNKRQFSCLLYNFITSLDGNMQEFRKKGRQMT